MFVDHGISPEFYSQGLVDRRALWNYGEQKEVETDQMSCRMRVDGQAFDEADQAKQYYPRVYVTVTSHYLAMTNKVNFFLRCSRTYCIRNLSGKSPSGSLPCT
jgi:hypothetical protein